MSVRDWCPQVRVITKAHYSLLSVGLCAAKASVSDGCQQQIIKVWLPHNI